MGAKMNVIANDAYEKNHGMVFEYGHTMSHALEKSYGDGVVPHGLGVVYGMLSSSFAARSLGLMSKGAQAEHDQLCQLLTNRWPLPDPKPSVQAVMRRAMRDSKRGIAQETDDELADVLLSSVGEVVPSDMSNLRAIPKALAEEWLRSMGFQDEKECGETLASNVMNSPMKTASNIGNKLDAEMQLEKAGGSDNFAVMEAMMKQIMEL